MPARRSTTSAPGDYEPGNVGAPPDEPDRDDEPEVDDKGKRRPYPDRIRDLDERIAYMTAERRRLSIEYLAERLKAYEGLKPLARRLRARLRAGMPDVDAMALEYEAALESHQRKPTGPDGA